MALIAAAAFVTAKLILMKKEAEDCRPYFWPHFWLALPGIGILAGAFFFWPGKTQEDG